MSNFTTGLPDLFQSDIVTRLGGDAWLDDCVIIQERTGTVETDADLAYKGELPSSKTGKYGAFVIVELPELHPQKNVRGQYEFRCRVLTRTIPKFNNVDASGTLKQAGEIAVRVGQNLNLFIRGNGTWREEKAEPYSDSAGAVGYDHTIVWECGVPNLAWCATPKIADAAGTVTLTTPDAGASIYYTTDDSFPAAANPAATLYTAPFVVSSGSYVCAAAYLADRLGSGIQRARIVAPASSSSSSSSSSTGGGTGAPDTTMQAGHSNLSMGDITFTVNISPALSAPARAAHATVSKPTLGDVITAAWRPTSDIDKVIFDLSAAVPATGYAIYWDYSEPLP